MDTMALGYMLAGIVSIGVGYAAVRGWKTYRRLRGQRLVTCPENHQPAAVSLAARAAAREAIVGQPHLHLAECSRWPERRDCAQGCLEQIQSNLEGSLVRNIVAQWYADKRCAYCGRSVAASEPVWGDHKPALATPTDAPVEWDNVPAEKLPAMFQNHLPVCWSCQIKESFRRRFPELVTDRPPSKARLRF